MSVNAHSTWHMPILFISSVVGPRISISGSQMVLKLLSPDHSLSNRTWGGWGGSSSSGPETKKKGPGILKLRN